VYDDKIVVEQWKRGQDRNKTSAQLLFCSLLQTLSGKSYISYTKVDVIEILTLHVPTRPRRLGDMAGGTRIGMKPDPYLCLCATRIGAGTCSPGEWVMRSEKL